MQVVEQSNIIKRLLFYWSKMYTKNIKIGNNYDKLNRCVVILIADFELKELVEMQKYVTKWVIKEKKYGKQMLTDIFELCIIELPKVTKYKENSDLDTWAKFIESPEVINVSDENNDAIKDAKRVLEDISSDEKERYLAELREKHILDQKEFISTGFKKGLEQGKIEIAKKLLKENISIQTICKTTGLSEKEILGLQ